MHNRIEIAKNIWELLFEGAMSYIDPDKRGYDDIFAYFDEYVNFEELIFASDSFYRDHTLHCIWVYFLGEYINKNDDYKDVLINEFKQVQNLFQDYDNTLRTSKQIYFLKISFISQIL